MAAPLSLDLRKRIAAAVLAAEETQPRIAERFCVSLSTVERISRKLNAGEGLEPQKHPGRQPLLDERHLERIRAELERDPYITSYELARRFNRVFSKNKVHRSTILRAMHRLGFSFKKRPRTRLHAIGRT